MESNSNPQPIRPKARRSWLTIFASVKLTVALMSLIALCVLLGAWCPQESQVGQDKIIEQFGEDMAFRLINLGVADIFHTPLFLGLIALLSLNMVACSVQRVFPKVRSLRQPMPLLSSSEIKRLPYHRQADLHHTREHSLSMFAELLRRSGYSVKTEGTRISAEYGKISRLAATVTHIGLLTLLAGVTITSWTGFSGFQPVPLGGSMTFAASEHSKLWIGKLPEWRVRVNGTRREDYPTGEPKQWYSDLSVIDSRGREVQHQTISVNTPLSYDGVDIYQSSWALDRLFLRFNNVLRGFELRQMGNLYAAFLPLDDTTVLIFSVRDQTSPVRIFGKRPDWQAPRLLSTVEPGKSIRLGSVTLKYEKVVPVTGLQYKCDPGLGISYVAFAFIICGVLLAAIPHRQIWASSEYVNEEGNGDERIHANACILFVGGRSLKGRAAFEKGIDRLLCELKGKEVLQGELAHV